MQHFASRMQHFTLHTHLPHACKNFTELHHLQAGLHYRQGQAHTTYPPKQYHAWQIGRQQLRCYQLGLHSTRCHPFCVTAPKIWGA